MPELIPCTGITGICGYRTAIPAISNYDEQATTTRLRSRIRSYRRTPLSQEFGS